MLYIGNEKLKPKINNNNATFRIPEHYDSKIEYLQSTGAQWIDTKILAYTPDSYKIICKVVNIDNNRKIICGSFIGASDRSLALEFGGSSNRYPRILRGWVSDSNTNTNLWTSTAMDLNVDIDIQWEWDPNTKKLTIIGSDGQHNVNDSVTFSSALSYNSAQTFYLFKDHRSGGSEIAYPLQIKQLQLYHNNTLVRNFIPVRVGQIGYLFDKVTERLFKNDGTGNFILGPDIQEE